jgi:hypothetical protein
MYRGFILFLLFFSSLLLPDLAKAEPKLEVLLSDQRISLDATITLTIAIEWPKQEAQYSFAFPALKLRNLSIDKQGESQETFLQDGKEWIKKTFLITLKPLQLGEGKIESFVVGYIEPATQKGGQFTVSEQSIQIIRSKGRIPSPFLLGLAAAGILGVLTAYFLWVRQYRKVETGPILSKDMEILRQFKTVQEAVGKTPQSEVLHDLSSLLRQFVIEHYHLASSQVTEQELPEVLKTRDVSRQEIEEIKRLFDRIYEAKFTGAVLSERDLNILCQDTAHFVEGKQIIGNTT